MAKEKKSTKATIDECDYRVGEHCLRPAIKAAAKQQVLCHRERIPRVRSGWRSGKPSSVP